MLKAQEKDNLDTLILFFSNQNSKIVKKTAFVY